MLYYLYAQVEILHNLDLTNGHIYEIAGFDLFVIVKYLRTPSAAVACVCPPVCRCSLVQRTTKEHMA